MKHYNYLGTYPAVLADSNLTLEARYVKYRDNGEVKLKFFKNEEEAAVWVSDNFWIIK